MDIVQNADTPKSVPFRTWNTHFENILKTVVLIETLFWKLNEGTSHITY